MAKSNKIPPQDQAMEQAVLGALMLEKSAYWKVTDLKAEMFFKESHAVIFETVQQLVSLNQPIDLLTVKNHLAKMGKLDLAGGIYYLTELTSKIASSANIQHHALIVMEKHKRRQAIRIADEMLSMAYDDSQDIFESLGWAHKEILLTEASSSNSSKTNVSDIYPAYKEELKTRQKVKAKLGTGKVLGVTYGCRILDVATEGARGGQLIVVGARPAMGKSNQMVSMALAAGRSGTSVGLISLEMTKTNLLDRMVANETGLDSLKIRSASLSPEIWEQIEMVGNQPWVNHVYLSDRPGLTLTDVTRQAMIWVYEKGCKALFIDYLQQMKLSTKKGFNSNKNDAIGEITTALKGLAKMLNIPIIIYSQLSRDLEKRGGPMQPSPSDLRDSGSIEQDADTIIFPWRPFAYNTAFIQKMFPYVSHEEFKKLILFLVRKQRDGLSGFDVPAFIDLKTSRIIDITDPGLIDRLGDSFSYILQPENRANFGIPEIEQSSQMSLIPTFDSNGKPITQDNEREEDFPF